MSTRAYPYKAWVLKPSFKPVEETFVKPYGSWSDTDYGDFTADGKLYSVGAIFPTREAAIAWGLDDLVKQQVTLNKRLATVAKKRDTLLQHVV